MCSSSSVGKPCIKRRRRSVDNIQMNLNDVGWAGVDWTYLSEGSDELWSSVNMAVSPEFTEVHRIHCLAEELLFQEGFC